LGSAGYAGYPAPVFDLFHRPRRVLAHQRLSVVERPCQCRQRSFVPDISQDDANVAEEPATLNPEDWRPTEKLAELRFVPRKVFNQRWRLAMLELAHWRSLGEPIPWTNFEAIVAAEDVVANEWSQFNRDRAFQFNRQVADAQARIELVGSDNGACGADIHAALAGAAILAFRRVGRQFEIRQDFAEEKPITKLAVDEIGVLANESKARTLREVAF
jgi:hypothetical protein